MGGDCGALGSEPIMFSGVPTAAGWVVLEPWGGGRGAGGEGAQKLMFPTLRIRRLHRGMGGAPPHSSSHAHPFCRR